MIEDRELHQIQLRHLALKGGLDGDSAVWWYGAVRRNSRDRTLPLVVVWFRKLLPDGGWGQSFFREVGVTDLALLQIGTIWNEGSCQSQFLFEEREVDVDFSQRGWHFANQADVFRHRQVELIPSAAYALRYPRSDRSEVLVFELGHGRQLLVPSLEFFSRCYGRSAEVNRILTTYGWNEAETRLFLPLDQPAPPTGWSVKLPSNLYNSDAMFVAHVKYDAYAQVAAKSIYSSLEAQFGSADGLAFPQIGPWFVGPATLIVQGIQLDRDRFLALRIVGSSEPQGAEIASFRENPGKADESASEDAPLSGWTGGRDRGPGDSKPPINLTSQDAAGQDGNVVEVSNPEFRIVGPRRSVVPHRLANAKTRPGPPIPNEKSDKHSPGERQGSGGATGMASIHTETRLETHGAIRDIWDALLYLNESMPKLVQKVGWYDPQSRAINFTDKEPCMVALPPFSEEQQEGMTAAARKWIYIEHDQTQIRGVLIAVAKTPARSAYLFEIERRNEQRTAKDGTPHIKEQAFSGLVVSPPVDADPGEWIPKVLDGIRREQGVMTRVMKYCPGTLVDYYRRSSSKTDKVAGHSTIIAALGKVHIDVPHPKADAPSKGSQATRPP